MLAGRRDAVTIAVVVELEAQLRDLRRGTFLPLHELQPVLDAIVCNCRLRLMIAARLVALCLTAIADLLLPNVHHNRLCFLYLHLSLLRLPLRVLWARHLVALVSKLFVCLLVDAEELRQVSHCVGEPGLEMLALIEPVQLEVLLSQHLLESELEVELKRRKLGGLVQLLHSELEQRDHVVDALVIYVLHLSGREPPVNGH